MHRYPIQKSAESGECSQFRDEAQRIEEESLSSKAAFSREHDRAYGHEDDHRLPYKRDVDRIIHSKAYARYSDKTQVAYLIANDHITHRGLHVQLVNNFSRGIAEILRLNLDLVEAIALGHDVGHPPFGHEGEEYISQLSVKHGNGQFAHPWQSCRLFNHVEPLNLGLAVYDGFLCHDGGMRNTVLEPRFGKSWTDHIDELAWKKEDPETQLLPATLEGCLVKICDTVSYLGRDIEDAISLGILTREQIPWTMLGIYNRDILCRVARDIIRNSHGKPYIAISDQVMVALQELRSFNFEKIYSHPGLKVESEKIQKSYKVLFTELLEDERSKGEKSYLHRNFTATKGESYKKEASDVQRVVDYISGMTDHYFVRTLESFITPKPIRLT